MIRKILLAAAAGILLVGAAGGAFAEQAPPPDPATIPVPVFDYDTDPAKALVARVRFDSRTQAHVLSTTVSTQRARGHSGEPPILRLRLTDVDGAELDRINAWSPLWRLDGGPNGSKGIRPNGTGNFIVPFSPSLAAMTVTDVRLNQQVVTVDLAAPIRTFCKDNPADPDCRESDLSVTAVEPSAPLFGVLGQPITVTVASTVANGGSDGPSDARVRREVSAGGGLTIGDAAPVTTDVPVAVGTPQRLTRTYTVTCTQPGTATLTATTRVAPKLPTVVDAVPGNDVRSATLPVTCAVPATVNIKPGSAENIVNINPGVLPVGVLSTGAGEYGNPVAIDATTIDWSTLRLGSPSRILAGLGAREKHGRIHTENVQEPDDRTRDGDTDAMLHFDPISDAFQVGDTSGCVYGRVRVAGAMVAFYGCDRVVVRP
ncbi:hypothetical protein Ais01nite_13020 [Asanoa ishikariensis]|uniref:DUF11 domain-containing protein n=1 Tax=Asanoa ishikariensis TaxID=137265 RepID=A0A1H3SXQ7_9ACTN|nr:hypothetical protein [Asanoa ishikariensis]GIF63267.1 hypothetical protein Ais01nite_13020 [Asanoa ishikariensis]SDZ42913.1 hypothetical protein SAMN05421684_4925 [Asanoa ishikariensis]